MVKRRLVSLVLAVAMLVTMLTGVTIVSAEQETSGTAEAASGVTTLTVDQSAAVSDTTFNTICDAVTKAAEINPQSEDDRVIINVNPGDYEEQVVFDNVKYITLQQTPGTEGVVDLHWYYCTGYAAGNCDLSGSYNPDIDWYKYPPADSTGKTYAIGETIPAGTTLTYTDLNGESHTQTVSSEQCLGNTGGMNKMAALIIRNKAENITVKDFNIVNSVPLFATQGEKDAHLTPNDTFPDLPDRSALANCTEYTEEEPIASMSGGVTKSAYETYIKSNTLTAGQSAWLARSSVFNERGHAVSYYGGDKVTFENVRIRGGQDSLYAAGGRAYFKNCEIIGGTDYIYGGATAVFDNCKLGLEGFSDKSYGSPIAVGGHSTTRKYGYLFYNCTLYNMRDNNGTNNFGGPWQAGSQVTYYKCVIDDNASVGNSNFVLDPLGWRRFGAENGLSRSYEYGTTNISGAAVDFSQRVVNKSVEEGGPGMGTVLDEWQVLEFNPRNYFSAECDSAYTDDWDPMNFGETYLKEVDAAIASVDLTIPSNEETTFALPTAPSGITYKWESNSDNVQVSEDGTKITVIRPAAGEESIESSIILYAMNDATKFGDKKEIPVTITPTTNTTDVFNIPVTITASTSLETDSNYNITISYNGAVIKKYTVKVPAGATTATATIDNIPATAAGIVYDVKVVPESDEVTVITPTDGVTTVTGVTGKDVKLDVTAQSQIDYSLDVGIDYSSTDGVQKYDLIALVKAELEKLSQTDTSYLTSDQISVSYYLDVTQSTTGSGFIDILSTEPADTCSTSGVNSRFLLGKLGHWNQLDYVDSAQGYSGSSNGPDQWLNACGKFDTKTLSKTAVNIDYKTQTISASGSGTNAESSYTFETFPSQYEKGKLYMAIYPGSEKFEIHNVTVTYKRVVTDEPIATQVPKPTATPKPTEDPSVAYGTAVKNDDGSTTMLFGNSSIIQSTSQAKMVSDTVNGITLLRPDYFYPGSNGYGELRMAEIDLSNTGYDKVDVVVSNQGSSNVVVKVGGTEVASLTDVTTGGWTPFGTFTADLTTKDVSGSVTIESTVTSGYFCGNFAYLRFYSSDPSTATPEPAVTATPEPVVTATPEPSGDTVYTINETYFDDLGNLYVDYSSTGKVSGAELFVATYADSSEKELTKFDKFEIAADGKDTFTYQEPESGVTKLFIWDGTDNIVPLSNVKEVKAVKSEYNIDFTAMTEVPVYSEASGQGFVETSDAIMPSGYERQVAPTSNISISSDGASVTESDGSYLHYTSKSSKVTGPDGSEYSYDADDYNYGGLIYRIDTGAAGAYHIEVEVTGTSSDTKVAPTGMEAGRLTGTSNWDNCGQVPRTVSASWSGSVWSYDFATGEDFVEIEVEPAALPTSSAPQTVGIKSIKVTPLDVNSAGDKPTIHILGDSTQKAYSFNETISSWGQTLKNYFDLSKVNVVNYSMGGRAMKSNYNEGRFDEVLISGKAGDYVFIHSAHNDETVSLGRFDRGSSVGSVLATNNENYNRWLDMYVSAIKARGMIPVLVTAMPRTSSGKYSESTLKPNGFNPDSPANMRTKAASDSEVGLVELYAGAKKYIDSLDSTEIFYIYNTYEAGETPAQNSANGTNGDGTHYRESAAKQWCRIMLQSIYDQANSTDDTYADKAIMQDLVSLMPESVKNAAKSGDWSAVYPEMASDVSAVGIVPGATKQSKDNYYYRTNIEKALELGVLHKDTDNNFKPTQVITVGEFARGVEKAFGLEENSLTNYTKSYSELKATAAAAGEAETVEPEAEIDTENAVTAADEYTITVQQPEGGTVTIYNDSAYKTKTTDITSSVEANQVLSDNEYYTFTAPSEIVKKTDKSGVFADNSEITTSAIEIRNNGTKQPIYAAKADGVLTLYLMFVDHKLITCENTTDGVKTTKYINNTEIAGTTQTNYYNSVTFNVQAGKTYQVYTNGGTGRLFGIQYSSTDYPQSTESLVVNPGDTVRVVAEPNDYYINNSIIVNGETIATGKEGTFEATSNATVTAKFTKEPDLVEKTPIATDAALTREAMAAILYDAYQLADKTNMDQYISQNGGVPSPDDPNYDPNIKYEGTPYIPLAGWGTLTDKADIDEALFQKFKAAYNLGLIRSEQGIARGSIACGNVLEPKTEVTRAKAAKALVFCYILTQPLSNESQLIPDNHNYAAELAADIATPNPDAPSTPIGAE